MPTLTETDKQTRALLFIFGILSLLALVVGGINFFRKQQESGDITTLQRRLGDLQINQTVKDLYEGKPMTQLSGILLKDILGKEIPVDSLFNKATPTFVVLLTLNQCSSCLDQEIRILQQRSHLTQSDAVFVCYASNHYEAVRFKEIKKLRFPVYYDEPDSLRKKLKVESIPTLSLIIKDGHILYTQVPTADDAVRSERFLDRFLSLRSLSEK